MKAVHIHSLQTPIKGHANPESPALSSAYSFTATPSLNVSHLT